jgi:O-antigen biosynthesis alpha-1,3-abequosyltransferase
MPVPKLSFCIPTYNYGRYIGAAIESIRAQGLQDVEVLVLDGGSTDDTSEVVERAAASWPAVRYARQDARGGIDADLARSVELASGEYCWLLSADDTLVPGAGARIVAAFEAGADIALCNRYWCDSRLKPLYTQSWLKGGVQDRVVDLSNRSEMLQYLESAQSLGALFSFISCIGFRREAWQRAESRAYIVPCYSHVGRLFAMGRTGARLKYIAEPLVFCRGGADSFRAAGLAARLLIDLRGYRQLALALFADDEKCRRAFLAVMRREHPTRLWTGARGATRDRVQWQEVERELIAYGLTPWQLRLIRILGVGKGFLRSFAPERRD